MNSRFTRVAYLLRREFWEHNSSVFRTPLILAGVAAFFMITSYILHDYNIDIFSDSGNDSVESSQEPERVIDFSNGTIVLSDRVLVAEDFVAVSKSNLIRATLFAIFIGFQIVAFFVAVFYLQSCLYADRKDRSILFWKSLPLRETESTLTKFLFAIFFIPLLSFAVSLVLQIGTAVALSLSAGGVGDDSFLDIFFNVDLINIMSISFVFILFCALKSLPLYAWLMLSSAWAKRSPFLVAVIPPLAIIALEMLIYGSTHFLTLLANLIFVIDVGGDGFDFSNMESGMLLRDGLSVIATALMNISPAVAFISATVTIVFLSAAIWLRNNRYEI